MRSKAMPFLVGVLVGVVFANQIHSMPILDKIPQLQPMAQSTGIVLAAGAVVAVNEALFAPIVDHEPVSKTFNWRIIPAAAGLAVALAALSEIAPKFAAGLAWLTLLGVFIFPVGNAGTPLTNALAIMGYSGKAA